MSLQLIKEILEDADIFSYIKHGSYADTYDPCCEYISLRLSKDLSLDQIQNIIWNSFYNYLCIGIVPGTKEAFVLEEISALSILGDPVRFKGIAVNIRHMLYGL